MLRDALSARAQLASGVFHEELSAARRDTEVARFRADDGPSILVSTEAGGEGRNFEFCHRLVLYDLPWKPSAVEQRIGRLDRIGRRMPVEIVYFRPAVGHRRRRRAAVRAARDLPRADGRSRAAARAMSRARWKRSRSIRTRRCPMRRSSDSLRDAQAARTRIHEAAYQQLHRDPYRAELGPAILARVPAGLDALMEQVVVNAASRLGFRDRAGARQARLRDRIRQRGAHRQPARRSGRVVVRRLVRSRVRGRGREHRLLRIGPPARRRAPRAFRGGPEGACRAARATIPGHRGTGLIAIYKDGPQFEVVAFDAGGGARPDWADAFRSRPLGRAEDEDGGRRGARLAAIVARLAPQFGSRRPHAIAAVVVRSK